MLLPELCVITPAIPIDCCIYSLHKVVAVNGRGSLSCGQSYSYGPPPPITEPANPSDAVHPKKLSKYTGMLRTFTEALQHNRVKRSSLAQAGPVYIVSPFISKQVVQSSMQYSSEYSSESYIPTPS